MATDDNNDSVLASRSMLAMESDPRWPDLLESWKNEYQPDTPSYAQHVHRAAQAELELREEERRYDQANREWLQKDVIGWDDKQHKQERHLARRRDHAERIAIRWSSVVERFRRGRLVDNARHEKSRKPEPKPNPFFGPVSLTGVPFIQVVTVRVVDGVTTTHCSPTNAEMLRILQKSNRPGQEARRRLDLPDALPFEYQWAGHRDGTHPRRLFWNMNEEEFAALARREEEAGTPHVLNLNCLPLDTDQPVDGDPSLNGKETVLYP